MVVLHTPLFHLVYTKAGIILCMHPTNERWRYTAGIILCMRPANEIRRNCVTPSLIGWAHTQNDPWDRFLYKLHEVRLCFSHILHNNRTNSGLTPSQWETSLQSNAVSHWLGTNLESALQQQDSGSPLSYARTANRGNYLLSCHQ